MRHPVVKGFLAGTARTLASHPFDSLRVRRQVGKETSLAEFRQLYRGLAVPLATGAVVSAFVLNCERSLYGACRNHAVSGALTCLLATALTSPLDLIRTRQQAGSTGRARLHTGFRTAAARETLSGAVFFPLFNRLTRCTPGPVAGAAAGLACSLLTHPIDCIKTRVHAGVPLETALAQPLHAGLGEALAKAAVMNLATYGVWTLT